MINISLTNEQYNTIKTLFKGFKEVKQFPGQTINILNYVYYNSEKKEIIITDGHILRIESMDLEIDKNVLFDRKDFTKSEKHSITINAFEISDLMPYPDYEKLFPDDEFNLTENNAHCFQIQIEYLENFCKTVDKKYKAGLLFIPTTTRNHKDIHHSPIKVYRLSFYSIDKSNLPTKDEKYVICGLIMSMGKSECFLEQF